MADIERADVIDSCLQHYRRVKGDVGETSAEEDVIDFLSDLRHYCAMQTLDFEHLAAISHSHFCEEGGE